MLKKGEKKEVRWRYAVALRRCGLGDVREKKATQPKKAGGGKRGYFWGEN